MPSKRTLVPLAVAAIVLIVAWMAYTSAPIKWIDLINLACIAVLGATALNLLMGHAGLVSIGNAAFMGIGGLAFVETSIYLGLPVMLSLVVAVVAGAVAGMVVALPARRVRGLYLVMATLAFQFIVVFVLRKVQGEQVGATGYVVDPPSLLGAELLGPLDWFWPLLVIAAIWLLLYRNMLVRKPGRAWRAIREQRMLAEMSGVRTVRYEIVAFAVSSGVIALAGALQVLYVGVMSYESYTLLLAIQYLAMVIVGGLGTIYGPILGAAVLIALPTLIDSGAKSAGVASDGSAVFLIQGAAIGLVLVVVILVEPRGLAALGRRISGVVGRSRLQARPEGEG